MPSTTSPQSPALQRLRRDLERWRRTRPHRNTPIPERIWAAAMALARREGLYRAARALPIDYGALKQRLDAASPAPARDSRTGSSFVELPPVAAPACDDCVIELAGFGRTVRMRVPRIGLEQLAQLGRALAELDE
jgi:hypothetical protein